MRFWGTFLRERIRKVYMPLEIKNAKWIAVEQVGRVLAAIPAHVGGLYPIASHGVERGLKHTLEGALTHTPQAAFFWYRVNGE